MRCSSCGSQNPGEKKFCGDCGAPLANRCQKCNAANAPGKRFCGDCGAPLTANALTSRAKQLPAPPTETEICVTPEQADPPTLAQGERKTVTALFADIKGSTELMEDLDPEEARAIVDPALKLMIDAVASLRRLRRAIHRRRHLRAVRRAESRMRTIRSARCYAALRMQEEIKQLLGQLRAEGRAPIQVRDRGQHRRGRGALDPDRRRGNVEYTPIGHTTNLASRMQTLRRAGLDRG